MSEYIYIQDFDRLIVYPTGTGKKTVHECPACVGTGLVSKPPHIAGDQKTWVASGTGPYTCPACDGGVIWR